MQNDNAIVKKQTNKDKPKQNKATKQNKIHKQTNKQTNTPTKKQNRGIAVEGHFSPDLHPIEHGVIGERCNNFGIATNTRGMGRRTPEQSIRRRRWQTAVAGTRYRDY